MKANEVSQVVTDFGPFLRQEGRRPGASSGRETSRNTRAASTKTAIYVNYSEVAQNSSATIGFSGARPNSPWMRSMTR